MPIAALAAPPADRCPPADLGAARLGRRTRAHPFAGALVTAVVTAALVTGLLVTWGVVAARRGPAPVASQPKGVLTDLDRAALALPPGATTMFDPGAATAVVAALGRALPAGSGFTQISLYADYAVAVVSDPDHPAESHQIAWRSGRVEPVTGHAAGGDATLPGFVAGDVDWTAIAALAGSAATLAGVDRGVVSHVIVDRSPSDPQQAVTIRVAVTGPHGSGFVEASATGAVVAVY